MDQDITFKLGPLPMRVEGDHPIVRWARRTFDLLEVDEPPQVTFRLADERPQVRGPNSVGDDKVRVGSGEVGYRHRRFDLRVRREGDRWHADLRQRDRRPTWLRGLADPEEAFKMWLSHGASLDMHLLKVFAYDICPFVSQCALLERGASLIHASGVELDGRAVLLPAWGGGGKSTIVTRCVLHGRGRFLADDHVVVTEDGHAHLHLLPVHVYVYHAQQDPLLRQRLLAVLPPRNRWHWRTTSRLRPRRAVRWVAPQDLFGRDKLARKASLEQVILLFRAPREDFVWEPLTAEAAAEACVAVVVEEINDLADRLALANAGWAPPILPDPAQAWMRTAGIYEAAFAGATCARVLVPQGAKADALMRFLAGHSPLLEQALS